MSAPSRLKIISGYMSRADQFAALVNPKTFSQFKASFIGYIELTHQYHSIIGLQYRSVIVKVKSNIDIPIESIAINSKTHAQTLHAAHGDQVSCSIITEMHSISKITVRLRKDAIIISYPKLADSLYVEPGYFIMTPLGLGIVEQGSGLYTYDHNSVMDDLLGSHDNHLCKSSERIISVPEALSINIDFCYMGIGGLKNQMEAIIRQVLISRIVNKSMREKYKVKDIRGILLYGPPGTGKTLIAKNISKIIPNAVIKKVNGPELSSKWHGETESNIRNIFDDAKKNSNKLHVIIFDEIDAIGRKRGESLSHIDDKILTQLLTMIDGLNSAENVLIIGITNRKDVLDPALIRAGRLECHIEIPLPSEAGRKEILDIYLNPLRSQKLVTDINSDIWSRILDGYSGADIESLIGRAKNLALLRNCDINANNINSKTELETFSQITNDDLNIASQEFQPTFSKNDDIVQRYITNYPLIENQDVNNVSSMIDTINSLKSAVNIILQEPMKKPYVIIRYLDNNPNNPINNDANNPINNDPNNPINNDPNYWEQQNRIIVCHLANSLELPYVRYISYNEFLGKNSIQNCNILNDAYINCLQSEKAVLILDLLDDVGDRALILRKRFIINNPLAQGKQLIIIVIDRICIQ